MRVVAKHNKDGEVAEVQALSDGVKGAINLELRGPCCGARLCGRRQPMRQRRQWRWRWRSRWTRGRDEKQVGLEFATYAILMM
jgi:hypothetical protein